MQNKNDDIFGDLFTKNNNQTHKKGDMAGQALNEFIQSFTIMYFMGIGYFFKLLFTQFFYLPITIGISIWALSRYTTNHYLHLKLIEDLFDYNEYSRDIVNWLLQYSQYYHELVLSIIMFSIVFLVVGIYFQTRNNKFKRIFEQCGIVSKNGKTPIFIAKETFKNKNYSLIFNAKGFAYSQFVQSREQLESFFPNEINSIIKGKKKNHIIINFSHSPDEFRDVFKSAGLINKFSDTPQLINKEEIEFDRIKFSFNSQGIAINQIQDKKEELESILKNEIESISIGDTPNIFSIIFTTIKIPKFVSYSQIKEEKALSPFSFYIGHTKKGPQAKILEELPHFLISGATGGGKSYFFRQVIFSLMNSTINESRPAKDQLLVYIIDLKGGIDASDFLDAPNVKIVKKIPNAVEILESAHSEMEKRFKYLENHRKKKIDPVKDKMPRIVIAIDEAASLFENKGTSTDEKSDILAARGLTIKLTRLSRAASMNMILATQKIDSGVLPTSVTENIEGRMIFKAGTLQGSIQVLGNKAAYTLPQIQGRSIWKCGTTQEEVQTPFLDEKTVQKYCKKLKSLKVNQIAEIQPDLTGTSKLRSNNNIENGGIIEK